MKKLNVKYMEKKDFCSKPFKKVVVIGESHVAQGMWVEVLGKQLCEFQGKPVPEMINSGIGGNAISPASPGYITSAKPSAMERFQKDVIDHNPDLVVISYGLNDMRAGMTPEEFQKELLYIVKKIQECINPVIVLTTIYNMSAYNIYPPNNKGSQEATEAYNLIIRQIAKSCDILLADIWDAEGKAPWVMMPDTVHANKLGHTLIGNRVFECIAQNCSCVAGPLRVSQEDAEKLLSKKHSEAMERVKERLSNMGEEYSAVYDEFGKNNELW